MTIFTMFWAHFRGPGLTVFREFSAEICVGHRSPKKASGGRFFVIFMRKCTKMGVLWEEAKVPETVFFSPWAPFGCPWGARGHHHGTQGCQNDPRGARNAGFPSRKWLLKCVQTLTAARPVAARWRGWKSAITSAVAVDRDFVNIYSQRS